jgi:hypothetical protein
MNDSDNTPDSRKSRIAPLILIGSTYRKAYLGIFIAFSIGLVLFFMFSAEFGDGLERTMEEGEAEESSEYEAPLSYGDDYPATFLAGVVGFVVVLATVYLYGKARERMNET